MTICTFVHLFGYYVSAFTQIGANADVTVVRVVVVASTIRVDVTSVVRVRDVRRAPTAPTPKQIYCR